MPRPKRSKSCGHSGRETPKEDIVQGMTEVEDVREETMETKEEINNEQSQVKAQDSKKDQFQAQSTEHQASHDELVGEDSEPIFLQSQCSPSGTPGKTKKRTKKSTPHKKSTPNKKSKSTPNKKSTPKRRKKHLIAYTFTEEQEVELAEWYRDNDCLYNRRLKAYKDTAKKTRIIEEKSKEYDPVCSVDQLNNFLKSMRTQYSRLTNPKSGKGTRDTPYSDRDQWILNTFRFLEGHIVRMKGRTLGRTSGSKGRVASQPREDDYSSPDLDTETDDHNDNSDNDQTTQEPDDALAEHESDSSYINVSAFGKGRGKLKRKSTTPKVSSEEAKERELLEKLIQRADEVRDLRRSSFALSSPPAKLSPHEEQVNGFVAYLTTQLRKVPQERWLNFTLDIMRMMQSYISPPSIPASLAQPPVHSQHEEPFHHQHQSSQGACSTYGRMPPTSFPPATFSSRQQMPPQRMKTPPGMFQDYHAPSPPSPYMTQQQNPGSSGFPRSSSGFFQQDYINTIETLQAPSMLPNQMGVQDGAMRSSPESAASAAVLPPSTTNT